MEQQSILNIVLVYKPDIFCMIPMWKNNELIEILEMCCQNLAFLGEDVCEVLYTMLSELLLVLTMANFAAVTLCEEK